LSMTSDSGLAARARTHKLSFMGAAYSMSAMPR
jgi:hypothetical protein